jgi:hypothetical protein
MAYTKQMAKENKEMTKLAKGLLATRNWKGTVANDHPDIIQTVRDEFPNVNPTRVSSRVITALHQLRAEAKHGKVSKHGGPRPNQTGRPPLPEDQKRQKVSTRLGPGYKELAQAIAEAEGLPGWGHAVEQALVKMVEGNQELKAKLAKEGIAVFFGTTERDQRSVRLRTWSSSDSSNTVKIDETG